MTPQAALDVFRRALTRAKADPALARDDAEREIVDSLIADLPEVADPDAVRFAAFLNIVVAEALLSGDFAEIVPAGDR